MDTYDSVSVPFNNFGCLQIRHNRFFFFFWLVIFCVSIDYFFFCLRICTHVSRCGHVVCKHVRVRPFQNDPASIRPRRAAQNIQTALSQETPQKNNAAVCQRGPVPRMQSCPGVVYNGRISDVCRGDVPVLYLNYTKWENLRRNKLLPSILGSPSCECPLVALAVLWQRALHPGWMYIDRPIAVHSSFMSDVSLEPRASSILSSFWGISVVCSPSPLIRSSLLSTRPPGSARRPAEPPRTPGRTIFPAWC